MKHTPGPWLVAGLPDRYGYESINADGPIAVAQVHRPERPPLPDVVGKANARLIAAAPDLYAALVETLDELQQAREIIGHPWPTATSAVAHRAEDALRKVELPK